MVFQPNDPRFWRAIIGLIALVVGSGLAWLVLQM
jgi:hypothetical protein